MGLSGRKEQKAGKEAEIYDVYLLPHRVWVIILRKMNWMGNLAGMEHKQIYRTFLVKPEGKMPLDTSSYRWEGNVKTDHKETR